MGFRRGVVVAVCVVVAGSSLAAVGAVSGSSAAVAGPALDNFECYTAAATPTAAVSVPFSATPHHVLVKNSFASGGFVAVPGAVALHCNPVQTIAGHSVTTPVTNPNAHLLCPTISPVALRVPSLVISKNQFGTGALKPTAVQSLCLASWENDTKPTFSKSSTPPNLDAYACYSAVHPKGTASFNVPSSVQLRDQFGTATRAVGAANVVCVPSTQTVNGTTTTLVNPAHTLVCFAIPASPVTARTVYDKNQFGVGAVKLGRNTELCVPSLKVVVPPPTTTTIAATTTTTTVVKHVITNFTAPSIAGPYDIATGPDGALWFTNYNYTLAANGGSIGRITTNGVVTSYADSTISRPDSMTKGSDGAMWFTNTGNSSIGRITTDGTTTITNYADPKISIANRITVGPDGSEWFTNQVNSVGWVTSSGGVVTYTDPSISSPQGIIAGPDGALWFTNYANNTIGRIATNGTVTSYSDPSIFFPLSITAGPDGALWFTNLDSTIGRITTTGTVTSYTDPSIAHAVGITTGSDGAIWFTNYDSNTIGRITTNGTITSYADPSISQPDGITAGPDHAIWFVNSGNNSIGRISI